MPPSIRSSHNRPLFDFLTFSHDTQAPVDYVPHRNPAPLCALFSVAESSVLRSLSRSRSLLRRSPFFAEREDANSVVLIPRFFASSSHCLFLSVRRDSFMAPFCFALLFCLDHTLGFGSVIFPTPLAHAILFALFLPPCLTFLAPLHQLRQSLASSSSHVLIIIHTYKHTHKYIRTHSCEPLTVINSILHHCICASMAARQVHEA